jgi:hypothetical protein
LNGLSWDLDAGIYLVVFEVTTAGSWTTMGRKPPPSFDLYRANGPDGWKAVQVEKFKQILSKWTL